MGSLIALPTPPSLITIPLTSTSWILVAIPGPQEAEESLRLPREHLSSACLNKEMKESKQVHQVYTCHVPPFACADACVAVCSCIRKSSVCFGKVPKWRIYPSSKFFVLVLPRWLLVALPATPPRQIFEQCKPVTATCTGVGLQGGPSPSLLPLLLVP